MRMHAVLLALALLASGAPRVWATPGDLAVRLCPSRGLHAYPLAAGTRFQSLVIPNIAIENRGGVPVTLDEVSLLLVDHGATIDVRTLSGESLRAPLKAGAAVQSNALALFPFQFCDGKLLGPAPKLANSDLLEPSSVALIANQVFGWKGSRDELRIVVRGKRGGRPEEVSASLPIWDEASHTALKFPLAGRWFVAVAGTPHGGHRWAIPEAFALDIVRIGAEDRTFRGDGQQFEDYYAYGAPVLAAAGGKVIEVVADQTEDPRVLRRPGESFDAYAARSGAIQMHLLSGGDHAIAGNTVLISHGNGEFSLYAHLKPASIRVHQGDDVSAGAVIASLGASGNVTEPHLHFQLCDAASVLHCAGVPLTFANVELPYADGARTIQAGDIIEAH